MFSSTVATLYSAPPGAVTGGVHTPDGLSLATTPGNKAACQPRARQLQH